MYLLIIVFILLLIILFFSCCCVYLNNSYYNSIKYSKNIIVPIETNKEYSNNINPMQIEIVNLNNVPN